MTALAVVLLSALFVARDALVLIYISALIALGFGPVVRADRAPEAHPGRQAAAALAGDSGGVSRDHRRAGRRRGAGGAAARRPGASALARPAVAVQSRAGLLDQVGTDHAAPHAGRSRPERADGQVDDGCGHVGRGNRCRRPRDGRRDRLRVHHDRHPGVLPAGRRAVAVRRLRAAVSACASRRGHPRGTRDLAPR